MTFGRTIAAAVASTTVVVSLVACSSDDATPAAETPSNSAFPVAIAGALGTS